MLQQNVAGHPVAVFRFPPRTKLPAGGTATVWSAKSRQGVTDPPHHFLWKQLNKWGTGPECTTILCKPNGQAVAWITSAPRVSRISRAYQQQTRSKKQQQQENEINIETGIFDESEDYSEDFSEECLVDGRGSRVAQYQYPQSYSNKKQPKPPKSGGRQRCSSGGGTRTSTSCSGGLNGLMRVESLPSTPSHPGLVRLNMPTASSTSDQHRYALQWLRTNHNVLFNPPTTTAAAVSSNNVKRDHHQPKSEPDYGSKPASS